jgi:hypothetical protein
MFQALSAATATPSTATPPTKQISQGHDAVHLPSAMMMDDDDSGEDVAAMDVDAEDGDDDMIMCSAKDLSQVQPFLM